jgi:hypothetical protein
MVHNICQKRLDAVEIEDVIPYIGGWVLRRVSPFGCKACKQSLLTGQSEAAIFRHKNFTDALYGLTQPSDASSAAFCQLERLFRAEIDSAKNGNGIMGRLLVKFQAVHFPFCQEHVHRSTSQLARLFARVRLHHWCRLKSRDLRAKKVAAANRSKFRKLL